jgi:hypothetical protein
MSDALQFLLLSFLTLLLLLGACFLLFLLLLGFLLFGSLSLSLKSGFTLLIALKDGDRFSNDTDHILAWRQHYIVRFINEGGSSHCRS